MLTLRTTLAAMLIAAPVLAGPGEAGRHGDFGPGFGPGPGHGPGDRFERIAGLLDLDEAQRAALERMRADGLAVARPKFDQMRALHEELRVLLDSGSTDAAAVGGKLLAIHQLRTELRAQRESAEAEFVKLLSDEQRFAFEALHEAREARGRRFGMRHRRFGPGPDGPPSELD